MTNLYSLSFDDVLLQPKFSFIKSRKDVDTSINFLGKTYTTPIISANMDSVTGPVLAKSMHENGAAACLHRFNTIEENVKEYLSCQTAFVSVGLGDKEFERFLALSEMGAKTFVIDVAHGASIETVNMYDRMREELKGNENIIVGNFANSQSIEDFNYHVKNKRKPDAFKVGIGGGSHCTTRVVTGCGNPTLGSVIDCSRLGFPIIADGGIRNSGDYSKALAAGAFMVMIGKLLAGTQESPGELVDKLGNTWKGPFTKETEGYKRYRGSASYDSYVKQGKVDTHRTPEGEASLVPYTGTVSEVLNTLNAGLRSSMSYLGAFNLQEFKNNCNITVITGSGLKENEAHGKS